MIIVIDVIIPVHNASSTIEDAVNSAMDQEFPQQLLPDFEEHTVSIFVCCYDDGSTDDSFSILKGLREKYSHSNQTENSKIQSSLLISSSTDGKGRGAGYARNQAIRLNEEAAQDDSDTFRFLCLLDSDDSMHKHRIAEQTHYMLKKVKPEMKERTLLGCTFLRDPPDSTWHYTSWANSLTDERLKLERFREVTILQPTWFMCRSRWSFLGGYVEAPLAGTAADLVEEEMSKNQRPRLIHSLHDDLDSLRLAEDLRFFHEHLWSGGDLRLHRGESPLVTYRHVMGQSQSYRTSRKLLLQLRVLAFERSILDSDQRWQQNGGQFVVWGAGRDGKEFVKALSSEMRDRVYCFVDVDCKKLNSGSYVNRQLGLNIPIVHYSYLAKDCKVREKIQREWETELSNDEVVGCIDKTKRQDSSSKDSTRAPKSKRRRIIPIPDLGISKLNQSRLTTVPIVVCVAMYRTNGVLERNVKAIGRTEGIDLWHFS